MALKSRATLFTTLNFSGLKLELKENLTTFLEIEAQLASTFCDMAELTQTYP